MMEENKQNFNELNSTIYRLKDEIVNNTESIKKLQQENDQLQNKIKHCEFQLRKKNLIIFGMDEERRENGLETYNLVTHLCNEIFGLNLNNDQIEEAFRIGRGKNRPILMKFTKKTNDIRKCINAISDCVLYIRNLRSDQQYSVFMEAAGTATRSDSLTSLRRNELMEECAPYKYKQLYFEILDNILTQLESRFQNYEKLKFLELGDTTRFSIYSQHFPTEALDSLFQNYETYFDSVKLRVELQTVFSPLHKETFHGKSLSELIKKMIESETSEILPNAFKLFCLIATIPSTSASVERSFSCLNGVKTFLRNSMIQERLSALACISIEKGILHKFQSRPTWNDDLIDGFAKKKDRRVNLLFK
ncbi:hypothetical protein ANN_19486 [Periplaneta americana]|uniref:HAT C-terminal dimerisation domain-containing protein n=1 Tax=Periplaneta americana TaxID=6978 RepID=A0ABQ8SAN6_PERAM|nr:hypothetical protein ANN_19486 [Periplaneta americana]